MPDEISLACTCDQDLPFGQKFSSNLSFFTTAEKKIVLGWGERIWLSQPDLKTPSFYFPDYFLRSKKPWCTHANHLELSIEELIAALAYLNTSPESLEWFSPNRDFFNASFNRLQLKFAANTLTKAVPYMFAEAETELSPQILQASFINLLKRANSDPIYGYGFWENNAGMLGGTPEILFRAYGPGNRHLETVACAGTRPPNSDEKSFLDDPKESYEHRLVIQGIVASISRLGTKAEVDKTVVLHLSRCSHLLTSIKATFSEDIPFDSLVNILHPTPALGAIPTWPEGMAWLEEYDVNMPRGRFGAPAGIILPASGKSLCLVAIRNVQWQGNQLRIGAGCGVVPDSLFENEWNELLLKIGSIKDILGL